MNGGNRDEPILWKWGYPIAVFILEMLAVVWFTCFLASPVLIVLMALNLI